MALVLHASSAEVQLAPPPLADADESKPVTCATSTRRCGSVSNRCSKSSNMDRSKPEVNDTGSAWSARCCFKCATAKAGSASRKINQSAGGADTCVALMDTAEAAADDEDKEVDEVAR